MGEGEPSGHTHPQVHDTSIMRVRCLFQHSIGDPGAHPGSRTAALGADMFPCSSQLSAQSHLLHEALLQTTLFSLRGFPLAAPIATRRDVVCVSVDLSTIHHPSGSSCCVPELLEWGSAPGGWSTDSHIEPISYNNVCSFSVFLSVVSFLLWSGKEPSCLKPLKQLLAL